MPGWAAIRSQAHLARDFNEIGQVVAGDDVVEAGHLLGKGRAGFVVVRLRGHPAMLTSSVLANPRAACEQAARPVSMKRGPAVK